MQEDKHILEGQFIVEVEEWINQEGELDSLVLKLANGRMYSIEAEGGYLTLGEETQLESVEELFDAIDEGEDGNA